MAANVARPIPQRQQPAPGHSAPRPIPAGRRRSASASSSGSPKSSSLSQFVDSRFLGSCATTTPFSFLEEEEEREAEEATGSPPLAASVPRPSSSPPSPGPVLNGSQNSPPPATRAPVAATHGTNTPARRSSKRWHRLFDFDHVLGALDPARLASATAPDPIPIAVFGAETEEGIALCRQLLAARCWALVALMVDDDGPEAAELRAAGVTVVQVDMDDPTSYGKHLMNMRAVYLSTNGESFASRFRKNLGSATIGDPQFIRSGRREGTTLTAVLKLHAILQHQPEPQRTQIARQADACQLSKALNACQEAKVGLVVFRVTACGQEVVEGVLGRPKKVIEAQAELCKRGIAHTVLHTTVPYGRVREWLVRRGDRWVLECPIPDDIKMPMYALEQTGLYVISTIKAHIRKHVRLTPGEDVHAIGEWLTPLELARKIARVAKLPVDTAHVSRAEFASLETHERLTVRWDAWNQLITGEYQNEYGEYGKQARSSTTAVDQWTFDEWMDQDAELHRMMKQT